MKRTHLDVPPPAIEPGAFYQLDAFKFRMGWGNHAMRTARRNGLKVRYLGGRAFVHADDFFAYLSTLDTQENN